MKNESTSGRRKGKFLLWVLMGTERRTSDFVGEGAGAKVRMRYRGEDGK